MSNLNAPKHVPLLRFLAGQVDAMESLVVFKHLADCFGCRERIDGLVGERPLFLVNLPRPEKTSHIIANYIEHSLQNHVYQTKIGCKLIQVLQEAQKL